VAPVSLLTLVLLCFVSSAWGGTPSRREYVWRPLKIGAGGFITGLDIAPDGSKVVRADTYGAYIWDTAAMRWEQLVTAQGMPADEANHHQFAGVYEIRFSPSNSSRIYMMYLGRIFRSDDRGKTWERTGAPPRVSDANDKFRMNGQKMAVDPLDPDVVYSGSSRHGLWQTLDGGKSWRRVESVPLPVDGGGYTGIAFDPTTGKGGRTQRIVAASWGQGVWVSENAAETWSQAPGGPKEVHSGKFASDGTYYAADGSAAWKLERGTWTKLDSTRGWHAVVPDPREAAHVLIGDDAGRVMQSFDRGRSWQTDFLHRPPPQARTVSPDIPWLQWAGDTYLTNGDLALDPMDNQLYFANGIGVWRTQFPRTVKAYDWNSVNAGIEQMVANAILVPEGGKPLVASWDRPVFMIDDPERYPARYGPDNQHAIVMAWALDSAASNPKFVAGIFNWWGREKSSYSTDGGRSWKEFASKPIEVTRDAKIGGSIAVSTRENIVWAPSNNAGVYFTKDGGATWRRSYFGDKAADAGQGWSWAYFLRRHFVTADRVTPGVFYAYNFMSGVFRSEDGGATWRKVRAGTLLGASSYNAKLKAVPGRPGELIFTAGPLGDGSSVRPAASYLLRSRDGGATWRPIPRVLEVYDFGFGKPAQGSGYPTIYVVGWVQWRWGVWRSDDEGATWQKIGHRPLNRLDGITAVAGDPNIEGRVYLGFAGSGYAYGDPAPSH
jgi:photosystem II stability/assembly factor-like uncharacterized protein